MSVNRAVADSQREGVECGNKCEVDVKCRMESTQGESIGFDTQGVSIVKPCEVECVVYEDSSKGETNRGCMENAIGNCVGCQNISGLCDNEKTDPQRKKNAKSKIADNGTDT